jgi:hypothetical protein
MRALVRGPLVVLLLFVISGGHWFALQSLAWTAMLVGNLRASSITVALSNTFDGQHPCPLCMAIAAGKKSETKSEQTIPSIKLEFVVFGTGFRLVPSLWRVVVPINESFIPAAVYQPPTPPPRAPLV